MWFRDNHSFDQHKQFIVENKALVVWLIFWSYTLLFVIFDGPFYFYIFHIKLWVFINPFSSSRNWVFEVFVKNFKIEFFHSYLYHRVKAEGQGNPLEDGVIVEIGKKHNRTPAQVGAKLTIIRLRRTIIFCGILLML